MIVSSKVLCPVCLNQDEFANQIENDIKEVQSFDKVVKEERHNESEIVIGEDEQL